MTPNLVPQHVGASRIMPPSAFLRKKFYGRRNPAETALAKAK